ncbi:MAG: class I SAM-dependent methyltransferase [Rudaea sp.]
MESFESLLKRTLHAAHDPRFEAALRDCVNLQGAHPLSMRVHPGDQMLTHSLREHRDAGAALSQYFNLSLQQYDAVTQILHALFAGRTDVDVLDFACGYGRLLRLLVTGMPRQRIFASELQAEALAFVSEAFAVRGIASHIDPAQFEPGRRFDFIWVASLFTHLPERLFHAWLGRLYALLKPGGVVCFSVRDCAQLGAGAQLPRDGFLYRGESENPDLEASIYGTAYADEAFTMRAIHAVAGEDCKVRRLVRALANEQELYILAADREHDFDALRGFRRGAWGWVDRRGLARDGELYLEGWAGSQDEGAATHVEIRIDGRVLSAPTGIARPDVQAVFGDERLAHSGWRIREALGGGGSHFVTVTSHAASGPPALLYAGEISPVT